MKLIPIKNQLLIKNIDVSFQTKQQCRVPEQFQLPGTALFNQKSLIAHFYNLFNIGRRKGFMFSQS